MEIAAYETGAPGRAALMSTDRRKFVSFYTGTKAAI
jgi:hypothetical protein